jgi:DNA-binding response OmpR family regulator
MRILIVSDNPSLCSVLERSFEQHALTSDVAPLEAAITACDGPVVVYHAPRWDSCSSKMTQRLGEQSAALFVVCPDAMRSMVRLAIAKAGALDGFPEDTASVRLLALRVQRFLYRVSPTRLELGPLVLEVLQGALSTVERTQLLTPGETRLLVALWPMSDAAAEKGLPAHALAVLARMPEPSVRNLVEYLRFKIADLTDDAVVLTHRRGYGYRLVLQEDFPGGDCAPGAR